jgi:hypothetical protein
MFVIPDKSSDLYPFWAAFKILYSRHFIPAHVDTITPPDVNPIPKIVKTFPLKSTTPE